MASGSERAAAYLQGKDDGPSIMEQMLAEASAARKAESERKESAKRAKAKKSFGSGLRAGFLSQGESKKAKKRGKSRDGAQSAGPASGASSRGSQSAAQGSKARGTASKAEEPASVTGKAQAASKGMVFEEVQQAMKAAEGGAAEKLLADGSWANGELFQKIMANPKLRKAMADPRAAAIFEQLQKDPHAVLAKAESEPELKEFLSLLMGTLGEHFTSLGEAKGEGESSGGASTQAPAAAAAAAAAAPALVPAQQSGQARNGGGFTVPENAGPEVARVLADPELREILMDGSMREVLQRCGDPQELRRMMLHPEYGPKIRKLAQAGLVKLVP